MYNYAVIEIIEKEENRVIGVFNSYEEAKNEAARCNRVGDYSYYVTPVL